MEASAHFAHHKKSTEHLSLLKQIQPWQLETWSSQEQQQGLRA